jgi:hypothetical protein
VIHPWGETWEDFLFFTTHHSPLTTHHFDGNACRLAAAKAEAVVAEANFQGVAERGEADDLDFFALDQSHLQEALHKTVVALDRFDPASLTHLKLIEGRHGGRMV